MSAFCKAGLRYIICMVKFNPKKKSSFFICAWHPIILPRTSDSSLVSRQSFHSFNNASQLSMTLWKQVALTFFPKLLGGPPSPPAPRSLHPLRYVNQDEARPEVTNAVNESSVLLVQDWAIKFLPRKFQQTESKDLQMMVIVHVFQTFNQDSHWKTEFPLESTEMCLLQAGQCWLLPLWGFYFGGQLCNSPS